MSKTTEPNNVEYTLDGRIAVITLSCPPVNALGIALRRDLQAALTRFAADEQAAAAVLCATGRLFSAGADINEFGQGQAIQSPALTDLIARAEVSNKPLICAIHGAALGGGLELALGCHFRVAATDAHIGLPEVNIGLLPGAGGTQRLPRLIGLEAAAEIISSGRQVSAQEGLALGVIDKVADIVNGDNAAEATRTAAVAFAEQVLKDRLPLRRASKRRDKLDPTTADTTSLQKLRSTLSRKARGQLSPLYCLDAVRAAAEHPFEQGLRRERELFNELLSSPQRAALTHAFFAERKVVNIPERDVGQALPLHRVGVIGGGTMGSGIGAALLYAGLTVTMIERDQASADAGRERVEKILNAGVERGKLSAEQRNKLAAQFSASIDFNTLSDADLIIEAAFEDLTVKQQLFQRLDAIAKPNAVLASNTSYLNINLLAAQTNRPEQVLGLHFFSPAHVMKLLEVVVAEQTSADTVMTGFALAERMNKTAVRAGVCDGFIGNRILQRYLQAASMAVEDGTSPYDVDRAMSGFGYPMGPYQMSDLAGLDIGWANRKRQLAAGYPGRYPHRFLDRIAEQGHYGQKTGRGVYRYEQTRTGNPDPEVLTLLDQLRAERNTQLQPLDGDDVIRRCLAAMINEGAKILHEGIAQRPLDIDITLLYGYGFPRWRGGPMFYADQLGLRQVLADLQSFADDGDPEFWQPAPLLNDLVRRGQNFAGLNR